MRRRTSRYLGVAYLSDPQGRHHLERWPTCPPNGL